LTCYIEACNPILDADLNKAKLLFDVNFWSVITVTKAFCPLLQAAKGTVVNHSSVGAKVCMPFLGIYSASKAALDQISDAMRMELRSIGVSVVILSTAGVRTKMLENRDPMDVPEGSIFAHHKADVEKIRNEEQPVGVEPMRFAETVVDRLLKSSKPTNIWAGESAFLAWFMLTFFPTSIVDWFIIRMTGMEPYFKYQKQRD
jgi:1-acylglycerone phosphate reductase